MFSSRATFAALVAAVVSTVGLQSARADFSLASQSVSIDAAERQAHFTLTFDQKPNFSASDSLGRQADSFQVEFDGKFDGGNAPFTEDDDTAVVRGEEIHLADALRVRSPVGNGGSGSGGWGPILTTVPFTVTGDTVAFSVPTADLGWSGGDYRYTVSSYSYGTETASAEGGRFVPLPPAVAMGGVGLVGAAIASAVMRRRARA